MLMIKEQEARNQQKRSVSQMLKMNPLANEEDIQEYKEWMVSKGTHYLTCVLHNIERDEKREEPIYINISLRKELIIQELNERIH